MNQHLLQRTEDVRARLERVQRWIPQLQACADIPTNQRIVVGCIGIRLRTNFRHFCIASQEAFDAEYLAWSARNLFELSIWAQYVTASEGNAVRFRQDEVIDLAEWQSAAMNLARKYEPTNEDLGTLNSQGEWLQEKRFEQGISPEQKHLNVGAVAKELGIAGLFYNINGFLSKLVHPTALSILLQIDRATEVRLREGLVGVGVGGAEDTLRPLVAFCERHGMSNCVLG